MLSVAHASHTRDDYYVQIANERCADDREGRSSIVEYVLDSVFYAYEKCGQTISLKAKEKIKVTIGNEMDAIIYDEYVNIIKNIYKKALSDLTDDELKIIVKNPLAASSFSPSHAKFHEKEDAAFLPKKKEIAEDLMSSAQNYVTHQSILNKIYKIAHVSRR